MIETLNPFQMIYDDEWFRLVYFKFKGKLGPLPFLDMY